jgi:Fic family protein
MEQRWIWQQSNWPSFCWDAARLQPLLEQAHQQRQRLAERLAGLDSHLACEALAALLSRESLSTAAIEGEELDPAEVRSSVARRLQLPLEPAQTRSSARVDGLVRLVWAATDQLDQPLTQAVLHDWHRGLFAEGSEGLRAVAIGELRGPLPMQVVSGAIGCERLHFEAPPRSGLEVELARWLDWFQHPPEGLDGLLRAGLAHLWFITLHPYEDGNGRLARAITDRALAQLEPAQGEVLIRRAFGLSARIMKERKGYYAVLERTQRGGLEVSAWLAWFLEQVCEAARLHGAVVDAVQAKALFWWRHRHSGFNPRQCKLLNRLLDAEPEGFEGGMTLRKAASLTGVSRATDWRDLSELVELRALEPIGAGRSRAYRISTGRPI